MVKPKIRYKTLLEIERHYFPKAYEERYLEQLFENPKKAGENIAQKLVNELKC